MKHLIQFLDKLDSANPTSNIYITVNTVNDIHVTTILSDNPALVIPKSEGIVIENVYHPDVSNSMDTQTGHLLRYL